jgi:dipeptidase
MLRLYMFYSRFCSSSMKWRIWNPLSYYPFSAPPDKKLSVADAMSFSSSTLVGTVWDPTAYDAWMIPDGKGGMVRSPFTQDVPQKEIRQLLGIRWSYSPSGGSYGMIAQLRGWLPDEIGGVYWFTVEQRQLSVYVPIYAGVTKINPIYSKFNTEVFQPDSARWAIKFAQSLVYLRYQDGLKILKAATDPLQASFLDEQAATDAAALALYQVDRAKADQFLTDYTWQAMDKVMQTYVDLRYVLIQKLAVSTGAGVPGTGGSYRGDDFVPAWPKG